MEGTIDFSKCCICQEKQRGERLLCPKNARLTEAQKLENFTNLVENLKKIRSKGIILEKVNLPAHLSAQTLFDNNALWHKACRVRLNDAPVEQKLKTHEANNPGPSQPAEETQAAKRLRQSFDKNQCLFCRGTSKEGLHEVRTLRFGTIYKAMATEMNNELLIVRLDNDDLVAVEAKYHNNCKIAFHNEYRKFNNNKSTEAANEQRFHEECCFFELVDSIKMDAANGVQLFPLAELKELLDERRKQFNLTSPSNVTRLKDKLVDVFKGDLIVQGSEMGEKNGSYIEWETSRATGGKSYP